MALTHIKSASVTNRDAVPQVQNTAGKGAPGDLKEVSDFGAAAGSDNINTTIQLVRVPFDAIVKEIVVTSPSQGATGIFDVGVYYATDGSNAAGAAALLAANAVDQDFFVVGIDVGGSAAHVHAAPGNTLKKDDQAGTPATVISTSAWVASMINKQLWDAVGLSANPGGFADIVATPTEAFGVGAANIGISVRYVQP